jgi:2-oxoglutarate ferredoxin oxidoreductase subunit delta
VAKIIINEERCKGCGLCIYHCPKNQIVISEEFNSKGYHPCLFRDTGECTGCKVCATMCPDVAIEVYK